MRALDEVYTATPFYGSRRLQVALQVALQRAGWPVNRKRVQRFMRQMGIKAVGPKRRLSQRRPGDRVYPYLLRDVAVERVDQVWSCDITYIRLQSGFVYLVAMLDWFSRYVLAWELSVTLDGQCCRDAVERALAAGRPDIFNTDQGAQFTSDAFTSLLRAAGVQISMDGRGRALDNVFVERLWRSVKYEEVYLKDYVSVPDARAGLTHYFAFYNHARAAAPGARVSDASGGVRWSCCGDACRLGAGMLMGTGRGPVEISRTRFPHPLRLPRFRGQVNAFGFHGMTCVQRSLPVGGVEPARSAGSNGLVGT